MPYFFLLLIFAFSSPVFAVSADLDSQISKLEFQGVHFGDFPSVDMICVRGLCPVGELGVGINTNSIVPPAYNQATAITHYNGVKISTPEFSYFEDKMFMVRFAIECKRQAVEECITAFKSGFDTEYRLFPVGEEEHRDATTPQVVEEFLTESGSLVTIVRRKGDAWYPYPSVHVIDRSLVDQMRKTFDPDYVPPKMVIFDSLREKNVKK